MALQQFIKIEVIYMANGILVDEATYFNDSETYTGNSGSETNKYVIEDVYDLIASDNTNNDSHCFRLVNDIDMRDHPTYKNGFSNNTVTTHNSGIFDGDGHSIKNLVLNSCGYDTFYFKIIQNTDFINLVMISCTDNPIAANRRDGGYFKNCNFGIYVSNCKYTPLYNQRIYDCCFNIKGVLTDGIEFYDTPIIRRTHINLDVTINSTHVIGISNNSYTLENCYFTGKIKNLTTLYSENALNNAKFSNSYIAVEYDGAVRDDAIGTMYIRGTGFIDKELWCKNGFTGLNENPGTGKVVPVTTAQAQDADYLNSIGFAVVSINI
jgi:hypothetical protein